MKKTPKSLTYLTGGVIGLAFVASLLSHNIVACVWELISFMWFAIAIRNRTHLEEAMSLIDRTMELLKDQQDILNKVNEAIKTAKSNEPTE